MPIQHAAFYSGALNSRKTCCVYVPANYELSDKPYPVVYLLHGLYGSQLDWTQKGNAEATLDRMIAAGQLRESIVVMPSDGEHDQGTFYTDWFDGSGAFEQYIAYDVVGFIDRRFRTIASPDFRMIAGLSMGGFGAVFLALRHPELFGAAASLSGALSTVNAMVDKDFARSGFGRMFGPIGGPYARERDLLLLAVKRNEEAGKPAIYFNCGKEDYLYGYNQSFKAHLDSIGYPYEYEEFAGEHTWNYWTDHLPDALRFIEGFFQGKDSR